MRCSFVAPRTEANRAVVTVELALIAPLFLFLLLGIVELGWLASDKIVLKMAAREGARAAALGAATSQIAERVQQRAPGLDPQRLSIVAEYRISSAEGEWSEWVLLEDVQSEEGETNNAPSGAQVRVSLSYAHEILIPGLFGFLTDEGRPGVCTLQASGVMRRE